MSQCECFRLQFGNVVERRRYFVYQLISTSSCSAWTHDFEEPNDSNGEDCAMAYYQMTDINKLLNDANCDNTYYVACDFYSAVTTSPTRNPTSIPSTSPSASPTTDPSSGPTDDPTKPPSADPTTGPTNDPTTDPTPDPTDEPTADPSKDPTKDPTTDPTSDPTADPTADPTDDPTADPTKDPTKDPTRYVHAIFVLDPRPFLKVHIEYDCQTGDPTIDPTADPTADPSADPSRDPTIDPTADPTSDPTNGPTVDPTSAPTASPSVDPTGDPTKDPTNDPTADPTTDPSRDPTKDPTSDPTDDPTDDPTKDPTDDPTADPTAEPTSDPTTDPSIDPTADPTSDPTDDPTSDPTIDPTADPTADPSTNPTADPTVDPTLEPTIEPTLDPTTEPTLDPTIDPTMNPTASPSAAPTRSPSLSPSTSPTADPTADPTSDPTVIPSVNPTKQPTSPTSIPTINPTFSPSFSPSNAPSFSPSNAPSLSPTAAPTPTCHDAKYKGSMSCVDDECDYLWGGESLVSNDCRFLLTMQNDGNLVMIGTPDVYDDPCTDGANPGCRRRRRLINFWYTLWSSNTSIADHSGKSVPKFSINSDGTMLIEEYIYKNVPSILPLLLWTQNTNISGNDIEFELSSMGCMSMNGWNTEWELCTSFTTTSTLTPTETNIIATEQSTLNESSVGDATDGFETDGNGSTSFPLILWIFIVLIGFALLGLLCCCIGRISYFSAVNDKGWIGSNEIMEKERQNKHEMVTSGSNQQSQSKEFYKDHSQVDSHKMEGVQHHRQETSGDGYLETQQLELWIQETSGME